MSTLGVGFAENNDYNVVEGELFGANFLAHKYDLAGDTNIEELIEDLGATSMRYPGGSITEYFFDLNDPNQSVVVDVDGHLQPPGTELEWVPLNDFLDFASASDLPVTIVLPTRNFIANTADANGDRWAAVDSELLGGFIEDLVSGKYGDADIIGLELGNEYWHSGGMNSVEYGRVASKMTQIINEKLIELEESFPWADDIDIIVQGGFDFGPDRLGDQYSGDAQDILEELNSKYGLSLGDDVVYSNGSINWTSVADHLILSEFNSAEFDGVDGIALHLYNDDIGHPNSSTFHLDNVNRTWLDRDPDLDIHVTEWNQDTFSDSLDPYEDYGLFQAQEILETVEEFALRGTEAAQIWPMLQVTRNALAQGTEYEELSPSGLLFSYLAENISGKHIIDMVETSSQTGVATNADTYLYYGEDEVTFFVSATGDGTNSVELDLSSIFEDFGTVNASILTVEDGENMGSKLAIGEFEAVAKAEIIDEEDNVLSASLEGGEILCMTISDFTPSHQFSEIINTLDDVDTVDPELPFPAVEPVEPPEDDAEQSIDDGEDPTVGLEWMGFFLPIMMLLGAF
ncbi:hypothetical protein [Aliiroseovarius crassostreae]|uniref:hypothetical protein n=1 Tax=Aliiroseovarius crassostreae TaxID=154981 RepID=UPI0021F93F5A|nr:hypothetical protein [Aliiroseovarius crassostreae]UWQ07291.1 hypothetical protein K3X25_10950 [Aliiroseovarius crassostreae]